MSILDGQFGKRRTPKIKEFVRSPFILCPDCSTKNFGVLMVCDRHYVRRCINCWYDQRFPLPPLNKKIIYLDQFVISNMAKELDPDRPDSKKDSSGFYLRLFEQLDRLFKLQLIICPYSPIHDRESIVVSEHYEKLRAVFRHLSHGIHFKDPLTLQNSSIFRSFSAWLNNTIPVQINRDDAFSKKIDTWNDVFRIEINAKHPEFADELKKINPQTTQDLHQVCQQWLTDPDFIFEETAIREMKGCGQSRLTTWVEACQRYHWVANRMVTPEGIDLLLSPSVVLIFEMLDKLKSTYPSISDQISRIHEFFNSEIFLSIPSIRISGYCWASVARQVRQVRNPEKFPKVGMSNDIQALSNYSFCCDAMFIDKELFHYISQPELRKELPKGCRFFCLQSKSKEEFLTYLRNIESEASPEHLKTIDEVYGDREGKPFVEILELLKERNHRKNKGKRPV